MLLRAEACGCPTFGGTWLALRAKPRHPAPLSSPASRHGRPCPHRARCTHHGHCTHHGRCTRVWRRRLCCCCCLCCCLYRCCCRCRCRGPPRAPEGRPLVAQGGASRRRSGTLGRTPPKGRAPAGAIAALDYAPASSAPSGRGSSGWPTTGSRFDGFAVSLHPWLQSFAPTGLRSQKQQNGAPSRKQQSELRTGSRRACKQKQQNGDATRSSKG